MWEKGLGVPLQQRSSLSTPQLSGNYWVGRSFIAEITWDVDWPGKPVCSVFLAFPGSSSATQGVGQGAPLEQRVFYYCRAEAS